MKGLDISARESLGGMRYRVYSATHLLLKFYLYPSKITKVLITAFRALWVPQRPFCQPLHLNLPQFTLIYLNLPQFISIYPQFTLIYFGLLSFTLITLITAFRPLWVPQRPLCEPLHIARPATVDFCWFFASIIMIWIVIMIT